MKISKNLLKQIITEELRNVIDESEDEKRQQIFQKMIDYSDYIEDQYLDYNDEYRDKTSKGRIGANYKKRSVK